MVEMRIRKTIIVKKYGSLGCIRMPRKPETNVVHTRLSPVDMERLKNVARGQSRSHSEIVREAVRRYLDQCDEEVIEFQETKIERRLKRLEDRLASLLARLGMDIGIVYNFLWHQSDPETRRQLFDKCYKDARARLANKLDVIEDDFKELLKEKVLSEEKTELKAPE